jgi:hypothetical protein
MAYRKMAEVGILLYKTTREGDPEPDLAIFLTL